MDMILEKCKFPSSFLLIFSNICCRYTLELPLFVFSINVVFLP